MRVKLLAILLIVAVAGGSVAVADSTPDIPGKAAAAADRPPQRPADEPGVINGANNPELIPDHVAYSILFRLVSNDQSQEGRKRIRSYVRLMGLGDQAAHSCSGELQPVDPGKERDVDAFIAAADEFRRRVSALDQQAADIKKRHWPDLDGAPMARLTRLQQQKERLIAEIVASLPNRLSADGAARVRAYVGERMKRRIKMKAGQADEHAPASPPGAEAGR